MTTTITTDAAAVSLAWRLALIAALFTPPMCGPSSCCGGGPSLASRLVTVLELRADRCP